MTTTIDAPQAARSHAVAAPVTAEQVRAIVESGPHLEWQSADCVQNTVWLGRVRGAFVGMVEQRGENEFHVTTRLGRSLGAFETLELAQDAFIKR